jgi:hypothetical protein
MQRTVRLVVLSVLLAFLVLGAASPRPVHADAVVGIGTGSCTESALDAVLGCSGPTGSPPLTGIRPRLWATTMRL